MVRYIEISALLVSFKRNSPKVKSSFVATNMSTHTKGVKMRNILVQYLIEKKWQDVQPLFGRTRTTSVIIFSN